MTNPEEPPQPTLDESADLPTDAETPSLALPPGEMAEEPLLLPSPAPRKPPAVSRLMARMAIEAAAEVAAARESTSSEVAEGQPSSDEDPVV